MVYLYSLTDPRPGRDEIYIGASRNPKRRLSAHLQCDDWQSRKTKWIEELKAEGLRPLLDILDAIDDADAPAAELRLIDLWRARWGSLCVNHGSQVPYPKPSAPKSEPQAAQQDSQPIQHVSNVASSPSLYDLFPMFAPKTPPQDG